MPLPVQRPGLTRPRGYRGQVYPTRAVREVRSTPPRGYGGQVYLARAIREAWSTMPTGLGPPSPPRPCN